jgi:hypothetical protein
MNDLESKGGCTIRTLTLKVTAKTIGPRMRFKSMVTDRGEQEGGTPTRKPGTRALVRIYIYWTNKACAD